MKAVILAAGEGTRMRPLTANLPKPLLPVAGKPFLRHTLEAVREAGVREVTVLIGWQGHRIRELFGKGDGLGLSIAYEEQSERLGTAHAIGRLREHVDGAFLSVNGDVVVRGDALRRLVAHHAKVRAPVMAVAEVEDPRPFGVVELDDGMIVGLEEKPKSPRSKLINAGIYVFEPDIFPLIDKTPKSSRGEYEITDTLRSLIEAGNLHGFRLPGDWIDVGRPWDLLRANEALLKDLKGKVQGTVEPGADLVGEVLVEEGARVRRGAVIEGPTIVGPGADVGPNCYIRPATSLGHKVKVGSACEVKNSILMDGTHVPHQNYVGDSILGERCNLGAGTKVANLRLDEATIRVNWRGTEIDTGLRKLGVIMGDDVKVGINASIDAGAIIGEGSFLGPGSRVRGNVAPGSRVF
jgi:UDP-N-acetylglucosamine diphosphorylase / glucose-1-phosphate thymidylyltransferase / UDP-N-acetylgalactosamine diphosphorylase / glucosamine-1-phosphate N-acetyltransferase / galactosamine-1-phosphate N-acetyltransferase